MPERFPLVSWFRRHRARVALLFAASVAVAVAGCTESFEGGAACPSLCPEKAAAFKDTTFEAVVQDTSVAGYPALGLSAGLLLVNRPDTLVTRAVIRFDALPSTFTPSGASAISSITAIDSVFLRLPLDSTARLGSLPVTLDIFDVDTAVSDTVTAVVSGLFRSDRLISSFVFTPNTTKDTLRVPLAKAPVLAKIIAGSRLRLGLRIRGGSGQLRLRAFSFGSGVPYITFDPSTDTAYVPLTVNTSTTVSALTADAALAYTVYTIVDKGSNPPDVQTLIVGGYPAYRSYLRFNVPKSITDSSTIVRAEVLLTQRRSTFASSGDTVTIVPLIPTTTTAITDLYRILDLAAEGSFASIDTTRLVPRDSGLKTLNVLSLLRSWPALPANVPRAIAFRIGIEGAQPAELRFFSSKAPAAVRPRLRITYQPRSEFAIP